MVVDGGIVKRGGGKTRESGSDALFFVVDSGPFFLTTLLFVSLRDCG